MLNLYIEHGSARAPRTPRKKVQKQRIKPAPPTYRLGLKELQQQPGRKIHLPTVHQDEWYPGQGLQSTGD